MTINCNHVTLKCCDHIMQFDTTTGFCVTANCGVTNWGITYWGEWMDEFRSNVSTDHSES